MQPKGLYERAEFITPDIISFIHARDDETRWQNMLVPFLEKVKPRVLVETGVCVGTSTDAILRVFEKQGGSLHSIEPTPIYDLFLIDHPNWTKYQDLSVNVLADIYKKVGPFDVFIHDSDHEVFCQTFEYEVAWNFVKADGWIFSDDYTWAGHNAWTKFCTRHKVSYRTMGAAAYFQKPKDAPAVGKDAAEEVVARAVKLASEAEALFKAMKANG